MAKLKFDTPLSLTGIRDLHLDLSAALLSNETLTGTTPTVDSSDVSLVTISSVAVNTAIITNDDGSQVAVGDAVQWKATVIKASTGSIKYRIAWAVMSSGSADTHEIEQDLEKYVTE